MRSPFQSSLFCRAISAALAVLQPCYCFSALSGTGLSSITTQLNPTRPTEAAGPDAPIVIGSNRGTPLVSSTPLPVSFSDDPSETEFFFCRMLPVALVPIGHPTNEENKALAGVLVAHLKRSQREDYSALQDFLNRFPNSAWKPALLVGLGMLWHQSGYLSKAMGAWEEAWRLSKAAGDPRARALADRAIGELLQMNAWAGRTLVLEQLLSELKDRPLTGGASEMASAARHTLWNLTNRPSSALSCGPSSLDGILPREKSDPRLLKLIEANATEKGFSLTQLKNLAQAWGASYQMAKRISDAPVPAKSLIHFKFGHYAAVLGSEEGRYQIYDPVFSRLYHRPFYLSESALAQESDGYFLVPGPELPAGWIALDDQQGAKILGGASNPVFHRDTDALTPDDFTSCDDAPDAPGMAHARAHLMLVSLNITDLPLAYVPPYGPSVKFRATYNQRDTTTQGSNPNLGDKWTFGWFSYIQDYGKSHYRDSVRRYVAGGGFLTHASYNSSTQLYTRDRDGGILQYFSGTSDYYVLTFPDGSKHVFSQPSNAADDGFTARLMYLTAIQDPAGNSLQIHYNANGLIDTVTDALGQTTQLFYDLANDPAKITRVQDPFQRTATFDYDQKGRLRKITDVIGMTSVFSYDSGSFINQMTTPYGVTAFYSFETESPPLYRSLTITDPLGHQEFVEYIDNYTGNQMPAGEPAPSGGLFAVDGLSYQNTFYFDKNAVAMDGGVWNPSHAKIYRWMHNEQGSDRIVNGLLDSFKEPFESRIWFNYPGQDAASIGNNVSLRRPSLVTRFVEAANGGSAQQTYQITYNNLGKPTIITDPISRQTKLDYYPNDVDLQKVRQTTDGINQTIVELGTYNSQHRPASFLDASRQTWTFSWNSAGQLTLVGPPGAPTGQDRKYTYDSSGYLTQIKEECGSCGDCPCVTKTTSFTYDGVGRIRTSTDSEGYLMTYDYDSLDRVTRVTYPDQTFEKYDYSRLDLIRTSDRAGHRTQITYDDGGRPTAVKDRLGRLTLFGWCGCGDLSTLTDPLGNLTTWVHDIQGRVIEKHYADYDPNSQNPKKIAYSYEPLSGRLQSITDARTQVKSFTYNLDDTLAAITYTGGGTASSTPSVAFSYDPAYNRLSAVTVTRPGNIVESTSYTYNPITGSQTTGAGRLASIDGPLGNDTITYGYDVLGRVTSRLINNVGESFAYDNLNRIYNHTTQIGSSWITWLNATFRPYSVLYPNNQLSVFSWFDNVGDQRLREIWNKTSSGATISKFDYQYDVLGRITNWTQQTDANAALSYGFEYDREGQLARWELPGSGAAHKAFTYLYDPAGNITTLQSEQGPDGSSGLLNLARLDYTNNLNQLNIRTPNGYLPARYRGKVNEPATVTVQGQGASLTPDPSSSTGGQIFTATTTVRRGDTGNYVTALATDFGANGGNKATNYYDIIVGIFDEKIYAYDDNGNCITSGSVTYEWDAEDRLIAINNGTARTELSYDAFGRRTKIVEKSNGTITSTKQFVWCGSEVCEERDGNNAVTKRFYPEGEQISGTSYYFTKDHLGSIREMIDSSGAKHARYDYSFYGARGANQVSSGAIEADFGFTGHYFHLPSGLYLAWFRAYDSDAGRWLSRDPLEEDGGGNLYCYVQNAPINAIDLFGLLDIYPDDFVGPMKYPKQIRVSDYIANNELRLRSDGNGLQPSLLGEMLLPGGGLLLAPKGSSLRLIGPRALAERELGEELAALAKLKKKPAVAVGAVDPSTGKAVAAVSGKGTCAEQAAADALGVGDKGIQFTKPVRPRTGELIPVCKKCQQRFGPSQFPKGTEFQ